MIQRRQHPRLALEAREPLWIAREVTRENLDRDLAFQRRIARAIDFAHPARAEQAVHVIRADPAARQHRRTDIAHQLRRDRRRVAVEKRARGRRLREQRLDFASQRLVARARLRQKRRALAGRSCRRAVIHPLDLRPAVRLHSRSCHAIPSAATPLPASSHA